MATDLRTGEYEADWVWQNVHHAIRQPAIGEPHRPGTIEVQLEEHRAAGIKAHLEAAGIQYQVIGKLELLDRIFAELAQASTSGLGRGMLDMPGVTAENKWAVSLKPRQYFTAVRRLTVSKAMPSSMVKCKSFQSGPWYALVMGQSGVTVGVALYEDLDVLEQTLAGELSDEENGRRHVRDIDDVWRSLRHVASRFDRG